MLRPRCPLLGGQLVHGNLRAANPVRCDCGAAGRWAERSACLFSQGAEFVERQSLARCRERALSSVSLVARVVEAAGCGCSAAEGRKRQLIGSAG